MKNIYGRSLLPKKAKNEMDVSVQHLTRDVFQSLPMLTEGSERIETATQTLAILIPTIMMAKHAPRSLSRRARINALEALIALSVVLLLVWYLMAPGIGVATLLPRPFASTVGARGTSVWL